MESPEDQKVIAPTKELYEIGVLLAPGGETRKIPGYWVMSTAPSEVENESPSLPEGLGSGSVEELAKALCGLKNPLLLVSVHGYNTTQKQALNRAHDFHTKLSAAAEDEEIENLAFLSYRWPSSGARFGKALLFPLEIATMPGPVMFLFLLGTLFVATSQLLFRGAGSGVPGTIFGYVLIAISATAAIFRASEYWRDNYRANQYGIPDLVSFFQNLDEAMVKHIKELKKQATETGVPADVPPRNHVRLSFVAHSMGAQVVTGLVRILSDVFDSDFNPKENRSNPEIGNHLKLHRLTLISPDIPAEALISRRANFLDASLRRFEEAYLFTNQMDAVLWSISTIANSFVFPARRVFSGYRLGNLAIDRPNGVHLAGGTAEEKPSPNVFTELYLGTDFFRPFGNPPRTLARIQGDTGEIAKEKADARNLADRFVYIEATDFKESRRRPLSFRWMHRTRWWLAHFLQLLGYPWLRDCHSGYFADTSLLTLILQTFRKGMTPDTCVGDMKLETWAKERSVRILFGRDSHGVAKRAGSKAR